MFKDAEAQLEKELQDVQEQFNTFGTNSHGRLMENVMNDTSMDSTNTNISRSENELSLQCEFVFNLLIAKQVNR